MVLPVLCLSLILVAPVRAEEVASDTASAATIDEATADNLTATDVEADEEIVNLASGGSLDEAVTEIEDFDGTEVDEIEKIPSNFGLWWRSVRETLTLTFTWGEMNKAEKALKFAEERMRIAQMIAEKAPDDTKAQEKAQKMIEKAQKFMEKVETKKDKWSEGASQEKMEKMVKNIAIHQSNSDMILDELEKELAEGDTTAISELREKGAGSCSRLLNAVANENISAETKEHLEEVKARIEEHATEVAEYNMERKTLQEKVRNGEESAKADLQALKEERQTQLQIRTENVEQIKTQLEEQAAAGDIKAEKKLEIINRVQENQKQTEEAAKESIQTQSQVQTQTQVQTTTGKNNDQSDNGSNSAARDEEVQALGEKIQAVLDEKNKVSESANVANGAGANKK